MTMSTAMTPGAILWETLSAILFDLDGTLVETDNRWAAIFARRLAPIKGVLPGFDNVAWGRKLVMSVETPANYAISTLEHVGLSSGLMGLTDRIRRSKGLATRDAVELVAGTQRLLAALKVRYKLAIVTTRARPEAYGFVAKGGLEAYFDAIITREDVWRMKPHPEPVRKAAALLGLPVERCLMVGDTVMDVLSARRAGAYAVAVLCGFGEREELERAGAQLVLDRPEQLLGYLP